jgi:DNA-binding response OmpR family regulator
MSALLHPHRGRVLLVDDDPDLLDLSSLVLSRAGFSVHEAGNASECLDSIHAERPDLILLDINLPDLNGLDLCRRIKADPATANIPVVHLSGERLESDEFSVRFLSGADGYIGRPIENHEFVARVDAALRKGGNAFREPTGLTR